MFLLYWLQTCQVTYILCFPVENVNSFGLSLIFTNISPSLGDFNSCYFIELSQWTFLNRHFTIVQQKKKNLNVFLHWLYSENSMLATQQQQLQASSDLPLACIYSYKCFMFEQKMCAYLGVL